jgi:hypothetical protein
MIDRESINLDVSGHYARPDIFRFSHKGLNEPDDTEADTR